MFKQLTQLDHAFRMVRNFCILFIIACVVLTTAISWYSFTQVNRAQERIYVLANGKVLEAFSEERNSKVSVEAGDHVKMFHFYFFTQDPDEAVIRNHITQALYLADGSAKTKFDNLEETSYYANLVAGNISQSIETDSIQVDVTRYPYYFRYRGTQVITRPASIIRRSLITEGYLRNVTRSTHNPHGFLIERWNIIENKDLNIRAR